jgi:CheY-like chemotaxis protein
MLERKPILLIEDDSDIRELMNQALLFENYPVATAEHGLEALGKLRATVGTAQLPGLILLDLMLPVMDGWNFIEECLKDPALASIPIVVISASNREARGKNIVGYLRKPIDLEDLFALVRKYCDQAASR